jgi:hypothetical protein
MINGPAETIKSKDGRVITGKVVSITDRGVEFQRTDRKIVMIEWAQMDVHDALRIQTARFVKEEYDKFHQQTVLSLKEPVQLTAHVWLDFRIILLDGQLQMPIISLDFTREDDDWEWLEYHPVTLLVDQERWGYKGDITTDVWKGGTVYEHVSVMLGVTRSNKLATAKTIECQVGTREYQCSGIPRASIMAVFAAWVAKGGDLKLAAKYDPLAQAELAADSKKPPH